MFFRLEVISSWYSVQRKLEVDRSHAVPPGEAKVQTRLACSGNFSANFLYHASCFRRVVDSSSNTFEEIMMGRSINC